MLINFSFLWYGAYRCFTLKIDTFTKNQTKIILINIFLFRPTCINIKRIYAKVPARFLGHIFVEIFDAGLDLPIKKILRASRPHFHIISTPSSDTMFSISNLHLLKCAMLILIVACVIQFSFQLVPGSSDGSKQQAKSLKNSGENQHLTGFSKHGFGKHDANTKSNCLAYVSENEEDSETHDHINPYSHEIMINSYKHFHYWDEKYFGVANFPQNVAKFAIETARNHSESSNNNYKFTKAIDIGCAVGRISYELSRTFENVIGVDFSHEMIGVANDFLKNGELEWNMPNEGEIYDEFGVTFNDLNLKTNITNLAFQQNDALNLDQKLQDFDLIVASNLIDRLKNPRKFLANAARRLVANNGILVLCTPYTWLEQYTNKSEWIGGIYDSEDEPVYGKDAVRKILMGEKLHLIKEENIEMVFRETKWEYVHSISHCMAWTNFQN